MSERSGIRVTAVFDIETAHWDKFVLGGLLIVGDEFRSFTWKEEAEYVDALLAIDGTLWAHNGGRYDALWLLAHLERRGLKARVNASSQRVTSIKVGTVEVRDSAGLVPMPLAKAAKLGGKEKTSPALPCKCGKACGGYCAIHRRMSKASFGLLTSYLRADCEATLGFLQAVETRAAELDIDLRGTIGASAYATAARWQNLAPATWGNDDNPSGSRAYRLARSGYYGGRVQVFRPSAVSGHRYDINSSYPAALERTLLPVGEHYLVASDRAKKAYGNGRPGIYQATVRVPPMHVPPLPWRGQDDRVHFPTGDVCGAWAAPELRYAELVGCEVRTFGRAIVWEDVAPVFQPFTRRVWDLRAEAGKDTVWGELWKWFANSVTGKLAQRPEGEVVLLSPEDPKACPGGPCSPHTCAAILGGGACCAHACTRSCGRWESLGANVWSRPTWRIAGNGHVHWAAYLTAVARVELHKQLVADDQNGRTAVYCDTDSCYSTAPRAYNVGPGLGQWLHEGPFEHFAALAPKTYRYWNPAPKKGPPRWIVKAKGIPDPTWELLAAGLPVPVTTGVNQFRSAARAGALFARRNMARRVLADGIHFGDRVLGPEGFTSPLSMIEIVDHGGTTRKQASLSATQAARGGR